MINFDLSLPDDDEWLENLETEDDYKDREQYDRSMTPPSPSLLELEEEDIHNESDEIQPPPSKKEICYTVLPINNCYSEASCRKIL